MYGGSGINTNNSGTIIPDPTIDGYLYCDGSVINNSDGNKKYEKLGNIIGQSFYDLEIHGGTVSPGYIYLPDFRSKTPVGYNAGVEHIGKTGGANTYKITQENLPAIPDHTHVLNSDATSGGDAILTITDTLTSSNGGHYHALMYGNGITGAVISGADSLLDAFPTIHYNARVASHRLLDKDDGGDRAIGTYSDDLNDYVYHVLYPTTHDNESFHTHTVNSITSTLTGNTGNVVPYEKPEQTQIDMRPAYLVTNFIIKY
jgi:microcystin-dependent protein